MKTNKSTHSAHALTLVEVLACLAVVAVLAAILLPALARSRPRSSRINCISNLKQVGLAFRMWSNDHGDKFPWEVSAETNGTMEFAESPSVYRHFLAISNELNTPKVLACSTDKQVSKQSDWSQFNNSHLSYFVGLDANEALPQTILTGDRNILGGQTGSNGIVRFDAQSQAGWGADMHKHAGNIGLGDGSSMQVTDNTLRRQIQSALQSANLPALRFSIPKPK